MSYRLSEKDRRALVWGAIVLLPFLVFIYGVRPYRAALTDTQEQLVFERDALVRERAAIAAARRNPALQHVADSLMSATAPRLFSGRDDVMASAELVWYLDETAGKHHVLLSEDATRAPAKPKNGVRTLNVDIRGESDLRGVLEFLQALERGSKLVRVNRLDISRPTRDADDIESVQFAATVSGYALVQETPLATPPAPRRAANVPVDSAATRGTASPNAPLNSAPAAATRGPGTP